MNITENQFTEVCAKTIADFKGPGNPVVLLALAAFAAKVAVKLFGKEEEEPKGYEAPKQEEPKREKPPALHTFSSALHCMRNGQKMKRLGWNGQDQYVYLATDFSYRAPDGHVVNAEHKAIGNKALVFHGTSGEQVGWLASQADMLAVDWVLVK